MRILKMPPQILRLVLLTLGIVGSYLVARAFLTPASFEQYGWYRGAALQEIAARTPVFAGKQACAECHADILKAMDSGPHKTLSCEACHGVSRDHAENPNITPAKIDRQSLHSLSRGQSVATGVVQADRRQGSLRRELHRVSRAASTQPNPMKTRFTRRGALAKLGGALAGVLSLPVARAAKAAVQKVFVSSGAPKDYDPTKHKWLMCIDANKCIGCGLCAEACKRRMACRKGLISAPGSSATSSPSRSRVPGRRAARRLWIRRTAACTAFPTARCRRRRFEQSFFVPKLCNLCEHSPCTQVCPVGATFDSPDGAVLIDPNYCIGCGFCIQACPYGCRFLVRSPGRREKCTLCYHRITRGLKPACVEICPTQARIFGDLKNPVPDDPIQKFYENNRVQVLKPHLGTEPRVFMPGLDKEVR